MVSMYHFLLFRIFRDKSAYLKVIFIFNLLGSVSYAAYGPLGIF